MKKPYIFGHRGAMGYEIENTIDSFEKAVVMGAGLETDLHLTKDNHLVCFHDPGFRIGTKFYTINLLTLEELNKIKFNDNRVIPTFDQVINRFKTTNKSLRYSCDIGNKKVGIALISLVKKYDILDKVEITEIKPRVLYALRKYDENIKLVHTTPHTLVKMNNKTVNFEKLRDNNINIINIKFDRAKIENFRNIIDNGMECYIWGVNSKARMKKVLGFRYKDKIPSAIYTNFPDILIDLRDNLIT